MASRKTHAADTERTPRATDEVRAVAPKKGDRFRCDQCGMELEITADCKCTDADMVRFECCGQEMVEV